MIYPNGPEVLRGDRVALRGEAEPYATVVSVGKQYITLNLDNGLRSKRRPFELALIRRAES